MKHTFTIGHLFGGSGGGAYGAQKAQVAIGDDSAEFRTVGSVDIDPASCEDFARLVGAPSLCADVSTMQPVELRAAWGDAAPDMVLMSPPCKGFSALLSAKKAREAKYEKLNRLLLDGLFLLCSTWDRPPSVIFVENVPRITNRGAILLDQARQVLRAHGYEVTPDDYHDCGQLGGLAQHRRRFFLVARCKQRVPWFIYQPPKLRVRGCGEVLGSLPVPGDEYAGGPMHRLPRISWLNWVRLALIPAGGDWRDLPGVVPPGKERREVHRRHVVADWDKPTQTVVGSGGAGAENISDPRVPALSDNPGRHHNKYSVGDWEKAARTVIGATRPGSGAPSVADPRTPGVGLGRTAENAGSFKGRPGLFRVADWNRPTNTVTGSVSISGSNGTAAVSDPRPREWNNNVYGVVDWRDAADTVTGSMKHDNSRASVADPRVPEPGPHWHALLPESPKKAPDFTPVIIAEDGTWHRPLTTLELAALQGLPTTINGAPLKLSGKSHTSWRERIGNMIPPPAAQAVASEMLLALLVAKTKSFRLGSTPIWIAPNPWSMEA